MTLRPVFRPRDLSRSRATPAVAALALGVLAVGGCSAPADDPADSIVRTTTSIAGAAVVGIERDTATACPDPVPADRPGGGVHPVEHAAGTTDVPDDPARIVVLDPAAMDAVCALGLWESVVGAVTTDGPVAQPAYLGTGIAEIPSVGVGTADPALVEEAAPDVVIGSAPEAVTALGTEAPAVAIGEDSVQWKDRFRLAAAALGRTAAADAAIEAYENEARGTGEALVASQTEASVVNFAGDTLVVEGPASFAGQVLADVGVRRPTQQRLEDAVTHDITSDVAAAEGDIVYAIMDDASKEHAESVMTGEDWEKLEAAVDNRVFAVETSVWTGGGLVAARAMLTDLQNTLNGYAS
ncbi:transporter [Rhodococcus rhodnii]|uniref:ABC Fe(3+) transporter n=2 Tax=Rhodococcus rhodnii TaxID=38312 RepID=R7WLW0_9NOCA|nr:ABC transporter substrate-binding protein [Rhodococcus rhodnii]EOM76282.1 ABC Fe(3+) transporter [Rhodococcus rhodnii LMG 5362]TXG90750.1 transporter [Rhodococcus rhodnii]